MLVADVGSNDRPMEFHVRERGKMRHERFFFFFFFLHVSFIQSRANKAQSLQRIIESSKYLRANYVMGSNCARVHGINTMGEKSQSASNRRAKRKTRFFFFFSVKKKRR